MKTKVIIVASIIALMAVTAAAMWWMYTRSRGVHGITVSRQEYPVCGIDLSAHNGKVDFDRLVNDSIDFVMLKATEGTSFKDSKFNQNYNEARRAGVPVVGVYHFFRFDTDGTMQAMNLINSLHGKVVDLPLVIDLEEWTNPSHISTDEIVERLQDMVDHLEVSGWPVMFYTNKDGYNRFIRNRFDDYPLWICSFSDPPLDPADCSDWVLWQYSHWGWIDACKGEVDLNTFNGNRRQWTDFVSGNHSRQTETPS